VSQSWSFASSNSIVCWLICIINGWSMTTGVVLYEIWLPEFFSFADLEAHGTYKLVCLQRIVAHCHLLSRASGKNEWQLAWRCCCRCQPTATASPACAPPTLLANPGAPPPDPLPHLGFCTISYSSPFLFLIQFDDRVQDVFPASVNDNC